jgi:hypothetical protein
MLHAFQHVFPENALPTAGLFPHLYALPYPNHALQTNSGAIFFLNIPGKSISFSRNVWIL